MPKRIQRKRTKGWRMPPTTVYVGRPTKWGNPYHVGKSYCDVMVKRGRATTVRSWDDIDAKTAVEFFEEAINGGWLSVKIQKEEIIAELRGKDLACWCPLDRACHADVLLRLANSEVKT